MMSTNPAPRRRRWLWRLLGVLATVGALWLLWTIGEGEWLRWEGNRELAAAIAETNQSDPTWRLDDLNAERNRLPEGKNGAELVPRIKRLCPKDWGPVSLDIDWEAIGKAPTNTRIPKEAIEETRRQCAAAKAAIELARTCKDYPLGFRTLQIKTHMIDTLLPDTQDTRLVANLIKSQIIIDIENGDFTRIADSLHAMLNLSRSVGNNTNILMQFVRVACRAITTRSLEWVLAQGELPPEGVAALQALWANDAEEPVLLNGLRGERAILNALVENFANGTTSIQDMQDYKDLGQHFSSLQWWHYRRTLLPGDHARILSGFLPLVALACKPIDEQVQQVATFRDPKFDSDHLLFRVLFPTVTKFAELSWQSVAEMRCTIAALACERYRQKRGRWPASLAELVPEYLPAIPLDPFDSQPLRLKRLPDGIVVYSIGLNRNDDGGSLKRPDNPNGTDDGFRLWDVTQRRKPAPR